MMVIIETMSRKQMCTKTIDRTFVRGRTGAYDAAGIGNSRLPDFDI